MFSNGFVKIAAEDGWSTISTLLSALEDGPFKVGERVAYNCELKWTNEPDGKHTGGGWTDSDWKTHGITRGDIGVVSAKDGKDYRVKWDKHQDEHPEWDHRYRQSELKKLPSRGK
jgi:hypothetical protein